MSNAEMEPVEIPAPDLIRLTGAKVLSIRDVTEEDYILPCSSRDGGSFLILELTTGEREEVFCPHITVYCPDSAFYDRLDAAPAAAKELNTLVMSHVNATPRTLSVANAKQVLAHFKVARFANLTHEQAVEGKAMVEKLVKAEREAKEEATRQANLMAHRTDRMEARAKDDAKWLGLWKVAGIGRDFTHRGGDPLVADAIRKLDPNNSSLWLASS